MKLLYLVLLLLPLLAQSSIRHQFASVKGTLLCGTAPAVNINVELYDQDNAPEDPDDLLDRTHSDIHGVFAVSGSTSEESDIEPILKITHDCDDEMNPGHRVFIFKVPYKYVTPPGVPETWFDIGTLNLETRLQNEERILPKMRRHHYYPRRRNYDSDFDFFDNF